MTDSSVPNVALFNIVDALQGRGYPEVEVGFYLDETAALEIARGEKELTRLTALSRTEEHDALEQELEKLKASLRSQKYTYHLRGVPNKVRQDALNKAYEKFPRTRNVLGAEEESEERDAYYTALLWEAMTVKIMDPSGAVQPAPDLATIEQFRSYAPLAALEEIGRGIQELTTGVRAGFEAAAQDTDFLS